MPELMGSGGKSLTSFWSRPEGKTGMIFGAGLIGLVGWGLFKILPFAVSIASNLLYLSLLGIALASVVYVVTDRQTRTIVAAGYRLLMRAITGLMVTIDPIGIVKNHIKDLYNRIEEMVSQITVVKSQIRYLDEQIEVAKKEHEQSMKLMSVAKREGKQNVLIFQGRKAGRRAEATLNYEQMKARLEVVYRVLLKLKENATFVAQDKEDEVNQAVIQFKAMKGAKAALRSAISVLQGDPDKLAMFEQSMEHMAGDIALANGEIDVFLDTSRGFLDSLDLQKMSYEQGALEELVKWEKGADMVLLDPGEKQLLLAESNSPLTPISFDLPDSAPVVRRRPGTAFDEFLGS